MQRTFLHFHFIPVTKLLKHVFHSLSEFTFWRSLFLLCQVLRCTCSQGPLLTPCTGKGSSSLWHGGSQSCLCSWMLSQFGSPGVLSFFIWNQIIVLFFSRGLKLRNPGVLVFISASAGLHPLYNTVAMAKSSGKILKWDSVTLRAKLSKIRGLFTGRASGWLCSCTYNGSFNFSENVL